MRLPGLAWLELTVDTDDTDDSVPIGRTLFRQRALFHPRGLAGHVYWALVYPFHGLVFGGMQRNITHAAQGLREQCDPTPGVPPPQLSDSPDQEGEGQDQEHLPELGCGRAAHALQPGNGHHDSSEDDLVGESPQQPPVGEDSHLEE
jgi:hypothetical protein